MIATWSDQDGDPVAVDLGEIVGLSVGDVTGPRPLGAGVRVTLVWCRGLAQPLMVAASFSDVLHRWTESRGQSLAVRAHPGVFPLVAHQYPTGGAK